jgi:trehalose-6-phosphate synthase
MIEKTKLVKIENETAFAKDTISKAVINTDLSGLEAYRARRKKAIELETKLDEINTLKQDVAEIKDLLRQLLRSKE